MITAKIKRIDTQKLNALIQGFDNLSKPMRLIGEYMKRSVDKNFRAEGRPKKWKKLSQYTTNMRKARGNFEPKILQDKGSLRQTIIYKYDRKSVVIGSPLKKAKILQEGGWHTFPAKTITPREKRKMGVFVTQSSALRTPIGKRRLKFKIGGQTIFAKKVNIPSQRKQIPARPFVLWQEGDINMVNKIIVNFVKGKIK